MNLQEARDKAVSESKLYGCVQHVCAVLCRQRGCDRYEVFNYKVSDWHDATVESYSNGVLCHKIELVSLL